MPSSPSDDTPAADSVVHDAYAAIRRPNFRRYWIGNVVSILGLQMQSVTVIWEVYRRTGNPFDVGLVGLVQVIPVLSLALLAGHVADRLDRKLVIIGALTLERAGVAGTGDGVVLRVAHRWRCSRCLFFIGVARAFLQPSKSCVPAAVGAARDFFKRRDLGPGRISVGFGGGPALGGWVLALTGHAYVVYLLQAAAATSFIVLLLGVEHDQPAVPHAGGHAQEPGRRNRVCLDATRLFWAPWRSTCSPCCWAERRRCCRFLPRTSCTLVRSATAGWLRRRLSARWRCRWP